MTQESAAWAWFRDGLSRGPLGTLHYPRRGCEREEAGTNSAGAKTVNSPQQAGPLLIRVASHAPTLAAQRGIQLMDRCIP